MKLEGVHHITCITENGQKNVDFNVAVKGLPRVTKTDNQDQTDVYHLFFADEEGSAGADLTFFEFPGVPEGRDGDGMIHEIRIRVGSAEALDFWATRLADNGIESENADGKLSFRDPEGLGLALTVDESGDPPLKAAHPEIPEEMALQGFDGARAYASNPDASAGLLEALEFERNGEDWEARGSERGGLYSYDAPPAEPGLQGSGTVHHIAWASSIEEHEKWRKKALSAGANATPVIDRFYFKSVYFREPCGVLLEIATLGPGFTVDEPLEHLGEKLSLPPAFEHLREQVEPTLRPIVNPRTDKA